MRRISVVIPVAAALAVAASAAFAQPRQPGGGYGPGSGMGPGMMGGGGYGMGPGMMGGPGRGGYGMGPGMMGGEFGGGMMGPGGGMMRGLWHLDLTDEQRQQVLKVQDEVRRKNWDLLGRMQDEQAKLRDAYFAGGKRDRSAILGAYKRIGDLRLQRIENSLDAAEKIEAMLTPQQREELRRWGPWWMTDTSQ